MKKDKRKIGIISHLYSHIIFNKEKEVMTSRKIFGILLIFLLMVNFVACKSKEVVKKEDVEQFVKNYKTIQYSIKDPSNPPSGNKSAEKVKEFFSEDTFNKLIANRTFEIPIFVAKRINKSIELQDVVLEKVKENTSGKVDYKYTLKLKVYNDRTSEIFKKKGELTVSTDKKLVITRDWEERIKVEEQPL